MRKAYILPLFLLLYLFFYMYGCGDNTEQAKLEGETIVPSLVQEITVNRMYTDDSMMIVYTRGDGSLSQPSEISSPLSIYFSIENPIHYVRPGYYKGNLSIKHFNDFYDVSLDVGDDADLKINEVYIMSYGSPIESIIVQGLHESELSDHMAPMYYSKILYGTEFRPNKIFLYMIHRHDLRLNAEEPIDEN